MEDCEYCIGCVGCVPNGQCELPTTTTTTTSTTTDTTSTTTIPTTTTTTTSLIPDEPDTIELKCVSVEFSVLVTETLLLFKAIDSGGFEVEVVSELLNSALVWFENEHEMNQLALGCTTESEKPVVNRLIPAAVYTVCLFENGGMQVSPFQCTSLLSSALSLDNKWLEISEKTRTVILIVVGSIVTAAVGSGIMVLRLRSRAKLQKAKNSNPLPATVPNNM
jgi:hypothetical protein